MANQQRLAGVLALVVATVLGLANCGGGSSTPTAPPTPAPTPAPVKDLLAQGSSPGIEAGFLYVFPPFTTSVSGTVEVVVDWTFATDNVDIYLVQGNNPCTVAQFNNRTCTFLAFSESTTAKPEKISAAGVPAGTLTLYIGNRGPAQEAVSFQVFLTH